MNKYITITKTNEELKNKNILVGFYGILISSNTKTSSILIFDKYNLEQYCIIEIPNNFFKIVDDIPQELTVETREFIKSLDSANKTQLNPPKFNEFDVVVVLKEKEAYSQYNIHKGYIGTITEEYAIDNKWRVIFSDPTTGKDIANILIHQDDLELYNK